MPGILIRINSKKNQGLTRLKHNRSLFDEAELELNKVYMGIVDFSSRIRDRILYSAEEKIGIVVYGDVYLDKQTDEAYSKKYDSPVCMIKDLYDKFGLDLVYKISGSFSLSIHDGEIGRTFVISDCIGSKPMYYRLNKDELILSSEPKAIINKENKISFDMKGVHSFLFYSFIIDDRTFFENLKILPPNCIFSYDHRVKKFFKKNYQRGMPQENFAKSHEKRENLLDTFSELFKYSIYQRIKNYSSIGLLLSDGIDSRILAAHCKEICDENKKRLTFYTFGYPGGVEDKVSKKVSEELGVERLLFPIPDDQIASFAKEIIRRGDGIPRIRDSHFVAGFKHLSSKHDYYLAGFSADIVFGKQLGSTFRDVIDRETLSDFIWTGYLRKARKKRFDYLYEQNECEEILRELKDTLKKTVNFQADLPVYKDFYTWNIEQRQCRYVAPIANYGNWYLPIGDPFMDKDLINFATSLPFELLKRKNFLRKFLEKNFPRLSQIDPSQIYARPRMHLSFILERMRRKFILGLQNTAQKISRGRVLFRKYDYRAYDYWLRTGSKDFCRDVIMRTSRANPFGFDPEGLKRLWHDHEICKSDNNIILCDIIHLQLLHEYLFGSLP